ncbi:MAG: Fe-S cluster assembly protein HesB [Actinomycetota bacterium]|nr:Fe-S cluster assembly protein HesB [Actinomycetota bacterium]
MTDRHGSVRLSQVPEADDLLSRDPLALLIGMLLDQQFPMERAFAGPYLLAERLGVARLDAAELAAVDSDRLVDVFRGPPALHRYPGSMAARVQALCRLLIERYDGSAEQLWSTADSGPELRRRIAELPGFGDQKARIFLALLGKQFAVRPEGWREAAGSYGDEGTTFSIADVTGPESLAAVRAHKQEMKAKAKAETKAPG